MTCDGEYEHDWQYAKTEYVGEITKKRFCWVCKKQEERRWVDK